MTVIIDRDLPRNEVLVYVRGADHALTLQDGERVWVPVVDGAEIPVFLRLPLHVWEELIREALRGGGVPHPDALADAQKVRDRLLGLVERIIDSDIAREAASR